MIITESEFLDATAEYIEGHGWAQRHFFAPDGSCCIRGGLTAVGKAQTPPFDWRIAGDAMYRIRCAVGYDIPWNDTPGRTKQEVLDLLRRLAKDARREEESRDDR